VNWGAVCSGSGPWPGYPYYGYNYITNIDVYMNGDHPFSMEFSDKQTSRDGNLYFDSTHFPDGSSIDLELKVTLQTGEQVWISGSALVYNKGLSYGNNTLNWGVASALNVQQQQVAMFPTSYLGTQDRKSTMLDDMPIFTHYYEYSHGAPGEFGDCAALSDSGFTYYLHSGEISARVSAKGTSFPPYAFVHCDSCESAGDTSLATAFGITESSVDRAFLGWTTTCPDSLQAMNWTQSVWQFLAAQKTVYEAVEDATAQWPSGAQWAIYGDSSTKVHGVYQGAVGQWFR